MDKDAIVTLFEILGDPRTQIGASDVSGPCPFAPYTGTHANKSPNFRVSINPDGPSLAYCFACKEGGRLQRTIERADAIAEGAYAEAVTFTRENDTPSLGVMFDKLAGRLANRQYEASRASRLDDDKQARMERFVRICMNPKLRPVAFLRERNLTAHDAKMWGIGYDPEKHRVTFPFWSVGGKLAGVQGRAVDEDDTAKYYFYRKEFGFDPNLYFFGEHRLDLAWREIILEEGPLDVIRSTTYGLRNVLGTFGGNITSARRARIAEWGLPVTLLYDGDSAGMVSAVKAAEVLSAVVPTKIATLLSSHDPDRSTREEVYDALAQREDFV